ncbi:hypothetical protein Tco_1284109 [Tanacetum coccineum]
MVEKDKIFQKNKRSVKQTEPSFDQLLELKNFKVELQAKDTTIEKLKANIKRLNKTSTTNNVKKDIDEIINIELEHRVTKLIAENNHLKQTYKQLYDSFKPSRVRAKEHAESLVNQLNQKSVEITDLNAQLQEKVFVITALKINIRKFKGKDIVDNAAQVSIATTIALGMYKLDQVTLALNDKNNRETYIYYLKHTMEQAATLREIFLGYVRDTCPDIHKSSEKLAAVMPINKKKIVSSMFDTRYELCFLEFVYDMNASSKSKSIKKAKKKEEWKPTGKGSNTSVAPSSSSSVDLSSDQIAKIMGYGDYQIENITISKVYYVEGLGHNLFFVGQFCDSDLDVALRKYTCFVRNLEGDDLLSGSWETNFIHCQ